MHTEWSWDTVVGSKEDSCARAVALGLPSIAFTEHADLTPWAMPAEIAPTLPEHFRVRLRSDGVLQPPDLDVVGYLACVQRCRERFPSLRLLSGVELSEPHRHPDRAKDLLRGGSFQRVLGVHALPIGDGFVEVSMACRHRPAERVVREYLSEVPRLAESASDFDVLAHVDYPIRSWPHHTTPYRPGLFEEEFRAVLAALARSGRTLEVNTKVPLHAEVIRWWREAGGQSISFGSDAHDPLAVARGFAEAAAVAESCGFCPGRSPHELWTRRVPR